MVPLRKLSLAMLGLLLAGCGTAATPVAVPAGEWGGRNADLQVTTAGATALFKCGATAQVTSHLALDGSGRFDVAGTYDPRLVQGGPRAARFSGSLSGSRLQLTVTVDQTALGPFDLAQGQAGSFDPCNF
jgi:hypothetical protein